MYPLWAGTWWLRGGRTTLGQEEMSRLEAATCSRRMESEGKEKKRSAQGKHAHVCLHIHESLFLSGWKSVRRRVSQRPGIMTLAATGTERQKAEPPMRTWTSQNQDRKLIPSRRPSLPPNWACAAQCVPPPAAASPTSPHSDDGSSLWRLRCLCHANRYLLTSLSCRSLQRRKRTAWQLDAQQQLPKRFPSFTPPAPP